MSIGPGHFVLAIKTARVKSLAKRLDRTRNRREWQKAADVARLLKILAEAQKIGDVSFVETYSIDVSRCDDILRQAQAIGISPLQDPELVNKHLPDLVLFSWEVA